MTKGKKNMAYHVLQMQQLVVTGAGEQYLFYAK
jgi:hypothetical protein